MKDVFRPKEIDDSSFDEAYLKGCVPLFFSRHLSIPTYPPAINHF